MKKLLPAIFAACLAGAGTAAAQDHGPVGITMGYPSTIGVIWHLTDRIAIVPEVSLSRNTNDSTFTSTTTVSSGLFNPTLTTITSTSTSETNGWSVSPGVSAQFYVAEWDAVSTYLTVGFNLVRGGITSTTSFEAPSLSNLVVVGGTTTRVETQKTDMDGFGVSGGFGVQYTPHRRFAVFGELGLRYSETESDSGVRNITSKASIWGNASSVGVIFYF